MQGLIASMLQLVVLLFNPIFSISAVIIIIVFIKKNKEYKSGAYYQITKHPYLSVK